jgi:DNA repair protein RecO (recombination protein O)
MLEKTNGIVLHTIKYSENSLILIVYTEEYGRQSYMLTGIHSKKTSSAKKLIQPLSILSFEVYYKSSRELQKIKEYKSISPLTGIHSSIVKTTIGLFIAEILYRAIKEEEKNSNLFSFIFNSIQYLDLADKGVENFHLTFLIQLSKYLGFFPDDNYDSYHSCFNTLIGSFVPFTEHDKNLVNPYESLIIKKIIHMNYHDLAELEITGSIRTAILDKLILFYQAHSEGISQMKSHKILQEVFSGNSRSPE